MRKRVSQRPSPHRHPVPVSVVLLTLNEEENLPGALESVKDWAEDVFVVDSLSTDRTIDIAREYGAHVVQRPFRGYGDQWRWATERLPITTPWVMKLDADERLSNELQQEIRECLQSGPRENGFVIRVRLWFMGRPLRAMVKTCRLWRKDEGVFSDVLVNEYLLVDGPTGRLRGFIEHMDAPNLHRWYEKQNRYTTMEAIMRVRGDALAARPRIFGTSLERRMFLKKVFFHVPFRYQLLWLNEVVARGSWLAGWVGLDWARLRVEVYRAIERKTKEMRVTGRIPEIPISPRGDFDPRVLASPLQAIVAANDENTKTGSR